MQDVDGRVGQIEDALEREATKLLRLSVVVRDAHDAITMQDLQGRILAWNPGAEKIFGYSADVAGPRRRRACTR